MQRHIVDHPKPLRDAPRLLHFLRIDRYNALHPATRILRRAPHLRQGSSRFAAFLKLDRGYRA